MSWIEEQRHRESREAVPGFEDLKPKKYESTDGDDIHYHKEAKDVISSGLDKNTTLFFVILAMCVVLPPVGIIMLLAYVVKLNNNRR